MVDKTYALAVTFSYLGTAGENVVHLAKRSAGDPTSAQFQALADDWADTWKGHQSSSLTWVSWRATQVLGDGVTYSTTTCRQVGGTIFEGDVTAGKVGSVGGDAMPPHDAVVVGIHTGQRGRSYRTRYAICGVAESEHANGELTPAAFVGWLGALAAWVAIYKSGGTNVDWDVVTFSRGLASGCFPDPNTRHHPLVHRQTATPESAIASMTSATMRATLSTQRSRGLY